MVTQALLNMAVAVGLFPITGQPLPLISKGGTATWINCVYIGMILSVSRYAAHLEELKAKDAKLALEITNNSQEQSAAQPTSELYNSDTVFEEDIDNMK